MAEAVDERAWREKDDGREMGKKKNKGASERQACWSRPLLLSSCPQ